MGLGHLVRALALARGLSSFFRVKLLNGGLLPHNVVVPAEIELINLPPLRLDGGQLVPCDGRTLEDAKRERTNLILDSLHRYKPQVVLTELFPFGRKKFEFELIPLMESAVNSHWSPLIVCSLRDILVSRASDSALYVARVSHLINQYFDLILVHSDPAFARFEDSFKSDTPLSCSTAHTGFVSADRTTDFKRDSTGPILVSAGGGLYGFNLLSTALAAQALLSQIEAIEMKVVAGPFLPETMFEVLCHTSSNQKGVTVVRSVPDLSEEMRSARASISQCGYNTSLEIIQSGVRALVVPFAGEGEDEQVKRARKLESLMAVQVLQETEATPVRMAEKIKELLEWTPRPPAFDFSGARRSADIIRNMLGSPRSSAFSGIQGQELEWQI
jgi:predicted glycosyltransferase